MASDNDQVRGLAATCAALTVLGLLALAGVDDPASPASRRSGRLLIAADYPGASSGGEVPSTVLPLFPATTTTTPAKPTATTTPAPLLAASPAPMTRPTLGTYAYAVSGSESLTGGGNRTLPPTMRLTAHRAGAAAADEVVFDLRFSDQHTQREILRFAADRVSVRHDAMNSTIGLASRAAAAHYTPTVGRVRIPLAAGAVASGSSDVTGANGERLRTEDWKVTTIGQRPLGWEVTLERTSRPGAVEHLRETRRMWFDTARAMWVKWETRLRAERSAAGLAVVYDLQYTATLTGFTPA